MPGDVNDLQAAASEYLAACAAALDALTDLGAPDRQFVSHGPPPLDCCSMLTVHVGQPQVAATAVGTGALAGGHRLVLTGPINLVTLTATIVRCAPSTPEGEAVAAGLLTDFAAETNADLWAIWQWIVARKNDVTLFGGECRETSLGPATSLFVEGLCAGWLIPVQVQIDGFTPAPT